MPERVVHALDVVEVHEQHDESTAVAILRRDRLGDTGSPEVAVPEPGERVPAGGVVGSFFGRPQQLGRPDHEHGDRHHQPQGAEPVEELLPRAGCDAGQGDRQQQAGPDNDAHGDRAAEKKAT